MLNYQGQSLAVVSSFALTLKSIYEIMIDSQLSSRANTGARTRSTDTRRAAIRVYTNV